MISAINWVLISGTLQCIWNRKSNIEGCDIETIRTDRWYFGVYDFKKPFFLEWRNRPGLPGMATRNPSLGLTHHTYNRLQAGCYLTIDLNFKEP